jgi:hypothetical protein
MNDRLNELLAQLGSRKITQAGFQELWNHAFDLSRRRYPTVGEQEREEIISVIMVSAAKAFSNPQAEKANRYAYFMQIFLSKFLDFFRKQPDGSIYKQIKDVLQTPTFCAHPPPHKKNKLNWKMTWWRPVAWQDSLQKAGADHIENILHTIATFAEAGIKIQLSEKKGFSIPETSLIAFILHIFSHAEGYYGQRLAFRAEDLKEMVMSRLWMVSRINPSMHSDAGDSEKEDVYDWPDSTSTGEEGYSSKHLADMYNNAIMLEQALVKQIRKDPRDLVLWMLYIRAIAPDAGALILEKELSLYMGLPQKHKSQLAVQWEKSAAMVKEWKNQGVDLAFDRSREVVVDVLGRHFSQFRK